MGCCVVNDGGTELVHNTVDPVFVPDGADEHMGLKLRIIGAQLLLDGVSVVFVNVEDHQFFRLEAGKLAAKLTADASTAAGDHDSLIFDQVRQATHIDSDNIPLQQIFNIDLPDGLDAHITVGQLVDAGHLLELAASAAADLPNLFLGLSGQGGDGQDDLRDAVFIHGGFDHVTAAHDPHAHQLTALFAGVIVDDADHLVLGEATVLEFPQHQSTGLTGTDEQGVLTAGVGQAGPKPTKETVREADHHGEHTQDHGAQHREGPGQRHKTRHNKQTLDHHDQCGGGENMYQLVRTGKSPKAVVQPEQGEQRQCHQGVCRGDSDQRV